MVPSVPKTSKALNILLWLPSLIRLYWRLLRDRRVSMWLKVMLVGALAYVLSPIDLIPDYLPFVGQIDDVLILVTAARWFVQMAPPDVVREHVQAIGGRSPL